jgi:predicted RNA-binding Zn-ribbon protein involved in translation (DUF1610 family)
MFQIDLLKMRGKGDFNCPKCGVKISPEDQTEDTYVILETIVKGENLDQVVLRCNKCRSHIHLVGFQIKTI